MRKIEVTAPVTRSARVTQVESMFDIPPQERAHREWEVDLPIDDPDWNVGLIVGPSGSGKSTIARAYFPEQTARELVWPKQKAVVDAFPKEMPVKEVVGNLTAVGFSSPPSWLQPFGTLSTGEQFRASLARTIAETPKDGITVVDEFTSTVDRQVAKVASHALQKAIRRQERQLVAVSCHSDIVDWLQPDWIYQPHLAKFTRRRLRRHPALNLRVFRVDRSLWRLFRHHHYLTADIHTGATCFGGWVGDELVAFVSYLEFPNRTAPAKKGHRVVVLPDWQGLGIRTVIAEWLGEHLWQQGYQFRVTFAHPAMVAHSLNNPRWRLVSAPDTRKQLRHGRPSARSGGMPARALDARWMRTWTFVYVPESIGT